MSKNPSERGENGFRTIQLVFERVKHRNWRSGPELCVLDLKHRVGHMPKAKNAVVVLCLESEMHR